MLRVNRRAESRVLVTLAGDLEALPTVGLLCTVDTDLPDRLGTVGREGAQTAWLGALLFLRCTVADRLR